MGVAARAAQAKCFRGGRRGHDKELVERDNRVRAQSRRNAHDLLSKLLLVARHLLRWRFEDLDTVLFEYLPLQVIRPFGNVRVYLAMPSHPRQHGDALLPHL